MNGFIGRHSEALITVVIAVLAVLVAVVSFKQHTADFEIYSTGEIVRLDKEDVRLDDRLLMLEQRERNYTEVLIRVDTHVEALQETVKILSHNMSKLVNGLHNHDDRGK